MSPSLTLLCVCALSYLRFSSALRANDNAHVSLGPEPNVVELINRVLKAMGGKEAFSSLSGITLHTAEYMMLSTFTLTGSDLGIGSIEVRH